jgi:hypothetical protein
MGPGVLPDRLIRPNSIALTAYPLPYTALTHDLAAAARPPLVRRSEFIKFITKSVG